MDDFLSFPEELLERGRRLANLGQDREARRCLEHLVSQAEASPGHRVAGYQVLAEIHSRQKEHKAARKCLAAALILDPTCPDLHHRMAQAILIDDDANPKRAWNHLNLAIAMQPTVAKFWCALGRTGLKLHRPNEAMRCFRKCLTLRPTGVTLLDELAEGLAKLNRSELTGTIIQRGAFALTARDRAYLQSRYRMYVMMNSNDVEVDRSTILSFPAIESRRRMTDGGGGIIRMDRSSAPTPRLLAFNRTSVDK